MKNLEQWTNFWLQGFPTSFAQELPYSYTGEIGTYWRSTVSELNENDKVLDIACGNGAVALLIADEALKTGKKLEIHAADAAKIHPLATNKNPHHTTSLKTLKFHSKVPAEKINALGNNFSLITSQFGFEYSRKEETAISIERTLKAGGKFKAICHNTHSKPYSDCTDEVCAFRLLKEKLKIPEKIKSFIFEAQNIQTTDQLKTHLDNPRISKKLNSIIESMESLITSHPSAAITAFVRNSTETFLQRNLLSDIDTKKKFITFLETELEYANQRSKDQINAALSSKRLTDLLSNFSKQGMETLVCEEFHEGSSCTGWRLEIQKT
ncbi:class I SAM-dependent methyltransferase [Microbulbifer sp. OS29]|uniref:Class I SAM-dependent methyltransferase n=1 Tax=Microbulbifer okhotskensis TaxID=2926617 RepID=A0A9X2ELB3_9GAMM|nr:class I SAM-dependent methyltransferase [Microbulbifer okhotskensis]MCO1333729.1 class I SAM-dependent methyltransferase [Microbulbifer okhotskensis]